jgi:uroporphyrinogen-III synthase
VDVDAALPSLSGRTIAITEARRASELATLIGKLGGVAYSAPAVVEVPRRDLGAARAVLERICAKEVSVVAFMTGVGTRAFFDLATRSGRRDDLLRALSALAVVARGPKPVAVLKEAGVRIDVVPSAPTSEGVLDALASYDLRGRTVAVQLYGDENRVLVDGLTARGARVLEIPLYEWAPPEDQELLTRLVDDLITGGIDVIAFTSSPQVRHLFLVADRRGLRDALAAGLRDRVTVAAIGPVCAATLREYGVTPHIQPEKGTMGALVHAIARHGTVPGRP